MPRTLADLLQGLTSRLPSSTMPGGPAGLLMTDDDSIPVLACAAGVRSSLISEVVHAVQLAGVGKHHGAQVILDQVTLSIGPKARIGLVGPNGVGKTTLLRIVAGHEARTMGR